MTVRIADRELIRISHPRTRYFVLYANETKMRTFTNKRDAEKFDRKVNPKRRKRR